MNEQINVESAIEQVEMGLQNMARVMWSFYEDLIEQGFSDEQAMFIVIEWAQENLWKTA